MRSFAFAILLLAAGCADLADVDHDAAQATIGGETPPMCDIDAKIGEAAGEAIRLWGEASGQPIPLPSRIELADFGEDREHGAAWIAKLDLIQVSTLTPPEKRASAIAHEIGHSLGLEHDLGTGDLMDPDRPSVVRLRPCISAELVAAAGFAGPGACARLTPEL